jgi:hypothetical protein
VEPPIALDCPSSFEETRERKPSGLDSIRFPVLGCRFSNGLPHWVFRNPFSHVFSLPFRFHRSSRSRRWEAQLLASTTAAHLHGVMLWSWIRYDWLAGLSPLVRCRAVLFVSDLRQDLPLVLDSHVPNGLALHSVNHDDPSHVNRVRRIAYCTVD